MQTESEQAYFTRIPQLPRTSQAIVEIQRAIGIAFSRTKAFVVHELASKNVNSLTEVSGLSLLAFKNSVDISHPVLLFNVALFV